MTDAAPPQGAGNLEVEQSLRQAIALHQAGQLQEAGECYRAILQARPDHPEAQHGMGVLAVQMRQHAAALPHLMAALEADPACGRYWLSYIDALFQAGQPEAAREVFALARQQGLDGPEAEALALRLEPIAPAASSPTPQEVDALLSLFNGGRFNEALPLAQDMTVRFPGHWMGWKMLGVLFNQMGRSADALLPMQKAAELLPGDAEAHNNLGITLQYLDRLEEAESSYRRALRINPDYARAHSNLGATLQSLGRPDEAEASYRRAIQINPNYVKAHCNLGAILQELGRLDEAEASLRQALQIDPGDADAHNSLGAVLQAADRPDEAEAVYRRAIQIKPEFTDALNNLALLFNTQGQWMKAWDALRQSLAIKEAAEAKNAFAACARHLHFTQGDHDIRAMMVRALAEPWVRPNELRQKCTEIVRLDPDIGECVTRALNAWPRRLPPRELFGANGLAAAASDPLLLALLDATPVCDIEMERFLTMARHALLEAATADADNIAALNFHSALSRQCFINEYVYAHSDDEIREAAGLRDSLAAALQADADIPALWPVAVAAYFPLCSIPLAARLLERSWPEHIAPLLAQQIREPAQEQQLRATIPRLTEIEGEVSLQVQHQYEENPYPRWIKTPPAAKPRNIAAHLHHKFPLVPFTCSIGSGSIDVLVAGCGTGQHPVGVAQRIRGARVTAIDLSMSSLSYAKRKAQELGLTSIEFAQADLLKLGALDRSFDAIESVGVLHHLADPWAGWRALLSSLRPGGFMKLGFYSEAARRNVVRIRDIIAGQHCGATADEIRRFRQNLMAMNGGEDFGTITASPDFFSISTCRDLLFHVQEHRMTLTGIDAFLRENKLSFLGFEMDAGILHAYRLRFPDDRAATCLAQWQIFENENPDTFSGMYQFWIQKIN